MFVKSRSDWYSLDWSGTEHYWYCWQWIKKVSPCLCSHSGPTLNFIAGSWKMDNWMNCQPQCQKLNKMCFTHYVNYSIISHWIKGDISLFVFSPGSAEINLGWGGKLNGHLMASCVRNIRTKNYQNLIIGFQVTVENVRDVFWDTVKLLTTVLTGTWQLLLNHSMGLVQVLSFCTRLVLGV